MLRDLLAHIRNLFVSKRYAELRFWRNEVGNYRAWYRGERSLYGAPSPREEEKVAADDESEAAVLTWHKLRQEPKYLSALDLPPEAFAGRRVLDIGAGPIPSATCFRGCELYCLDPLLPAYREAGFPLHRFPQVRFLHGPVERIPATDLFFDAVIAVNAIDHVDDIRKAAEEIARVLRTEGLLRIQAHYHRPKKCEPVRLDDDRMRELFGWCRGFRKISETALGADGEKVTLWSNF